MWYECLDIFISVHTMSRRLCVACTSYVFLFLVDVLIHFFKVVLSSFINFKDSISD